MLVKYYCNISVYLNTFSNTLSLCRLPKSPKNFLLPGLLRPVCLAVYYWNY